MSISLIVAAAENGAIGLEGAMPWHLPDDLKHFRRITLGHVIVMGRKTWLALPKKPLDGRENWVLSSSLRAGEGFQLFRSVDEVLSKDTPSLEIMIIGGATLYQQFLPHADKLYLTRVHADYGADTFLPEMDFGDWHVVDSVYHPIDEKHPVDFTFLTLIRKHHA